MKTARLITVAAAACILTQFSAAQITDTSGSFPENEPVQLPPTGLPGDPDDLPPAEPAKAAPAPANALPTPTPADAPAALPAGAHPETALVDANPGPPTPSIPRGVPTSVPLDDSPGNVQPVATGVPPANGEAAEMVEENGGWRINDAGLNDIFQFLAKGAGRQYFHNMKIMGPEFRVTGHLNDGDPIQQMEDLAFMYGLTLYTKGSTIYALTEAQLSQLPSTEFHYQLQYLRPDDMEQIKELIKPVLSPGTGIVNFEPKTNTIVIIDSAHHIEQARELLQNVDKAKGQIVVETKIFRVLSGTAERVGVDWSSTLGKDGISIDLNKSLNSIFGIGSYWSKTALTGGGGLIESVDATANLVLSPVQLSGVLRALASGGLAEQVSNPTLITEDNEKANISIIDRVPIITTTTTATTSGGNPTVTEEVRYKIDPEDPSISTDPEKHREIGISVGVTPTLLPDGTIRMKLRPRSAQIVEQVKSITGNFYPRVSESMIESISRVPDGHSLVVGGFYGEVKTNDKSKVPILGDIPIINFFFKSKEAEKEQTSLVFIVTPTSYDPTNSSAHTRHSNSVQSRASLQPDHDWIDPTNPGPAHEANMHRTLRGARDQTAPYYPTPAEQETKRGWWNRTRNSPATTTAPENGNNPRFNSARKR